MSAQNKWSEAEAHELKRMLRHGATTKDIAETLGRTIKSVEHRIALEQVQAEQCLKGAKALRNAAHLIPKPFVHQSFISRLCGDPAPGRSALDQKRGAA